MENEILIGVAIALLVAAGVLMEWRQWPRRRSTFFLTAWFVAGMVCLHYHRLDRMFMAFFSAHMAYVLGHSVKDDWAGTLNAGTASAHPTEAAKELPVQKE